MAFCWGVPLVPGKSGRSSVPFSTLPACLHTLLCELTCHALFATPRILCFLRTYFNSTCGGAWLTLFLALPRPSPPVWRELRAPGSNLSSPEVPPVWQAPLCTRLERSPADPANIRAARLVKSVISSPNK